MDMTQHENQFQVREIKKSLIRNATRQKSNQSNLHVLDIYRTNLLTELSILGVLSL